VTRDPLPTIPVRFGASSRQLFGLFHAATGALERAECVVVCNPFGHEAIRAHRLLRIVAERLAAAGFPVLRFDYYGTGDSDGDENGATLGQWSEDIVKADLEARRMSGQPHAAWLGLRLGATLAAMASAGTRMAPRRLVLWDPVLDGNAYLEELFRSQRKHLEAARVPGPWDPGTEGDTEALGFPIPAALRREIVALDAPRLLAASRAPNVTVLASEDFADLALLQSADTARRARLHGIAARMAWDTEEAIEAALVPAQALDAIVQCMTAAS